MIGEVTLNRLSEFIGHIPARSGLIVLILDGRGRTVADSQPALGGQQTNLAHLPIVREALEGRRVTRDLDIQGTAFIGTVAAVPPLDWTVLVANPPERHSCRL